MTLALLPLLASLTGAAATPAPYYESRELRLRVVHAVDLASVRWNLRREAKRAGVKRFVLMDRAGDGTPVKASHLPLHLALGAVLVLSYDARGAEVDVIIRDEADVLRPVSVRWDADAIRLEEGPGFEEMFVAGRDAAAVQADYGVTLQGAWEPHLIGLVDTALTRLTPDERAAVAGLPFVRKSVPPPDIGLATGPREELAAAYVHDADGARVEVYDVADEVSARFVGHAWDPDPPSLYVLLHELGHAIVHRPSRLLGERLAEVMARHTAVSAEFIAVRDAYNAGVRAFNASPSAARAAELDRLQARLAALAKEASDLAQAHDAGVAGADKTGISAASRAFVAVFPLEDAPTAYGRTDPDEALAECFALLKADPAALDRAAPRVRAWFEAGEHLRYEDPD